jgi:H/ACA ribonucleoprotein complex subunit 3
MKHYLGGTVLNFSPTDSIGKGGEADVYDIGSGKVVKIFKGPDHPDLLGDPTEVLKARMRIAEHQKKLPAFPKGLPQNVIFPIDLITSESGGGQILGYSMKFMKGSEVLFSYSDKDFQDAGISFETLKKIFLNLHDTVKGIHNVIVGGNPVVIGDFNDLNVLVKGTEVYAIDADSFQFDSFFCKTYTTKFVDPLLCDPNKSSPELCKPHNKESDWYAFAIMLMQSLLFVGPYGGVHHTKEKAKRVKDGRRPLERINVFHPEVRYPKFATPYQNLPDDLLQKFHMIFSKDERGEFPRKLIENIQWTVCDKCGTKHARRVCPCTTEVALGSIIQTQTIRGSVTATRIFQRKGTILHSTSENGKLRWIYFDGNSFRREDDSVIIDGKLDPQMRFRISGKKTIVGKGNQIAILGDGKPVTNITDSYGVLPIFDANSQYCYWTQNGRLVRNGEIAPELIGNVLEKQSLFWVGEKLGFGFYRAGAICVYFIFEADKQGINDNLSLPPIIGQLIDATCVFTSSLVWFFTSTQEAGKTMNQCLVINSRGELIASEKMEKANGHWLENIRGKCASGQFLFSASDDGVIRIDVSGNTLVQTRSYPDTEPFVDSNSKLYITRDGIAVVDTSNISILQIK